MKIRARHRTAVSMADVQVLPAQREAEVLQHTSASPAAGAAVATAVAPPTDRGRALLVGSSGGHLRQLMPVAELWPTADRAWVTFDTPDAVSQLTGESVRWAYWPTTRSARNLVRNTWLAWKLLRGGQFDVVVSTGAAVAVAFFLVARLRGVPTVFIEVYDRVDSRTLTARLCRPLTTLFCVQSPSQQELYQGSVLIGPLL